MAGRSGHLACFRISDGRVRVSQSFKVEAQSKAVVRCNAVFG